MKKKNKGFTMIELLAVITIMGVLSVIAIPAVTKYVTKGRNTSYDTMFKSSYEAAENYMMENDVVIPIGSTKEIKLSVLVKEQYLEALADPSSKSGGYCETSNDSKVIVKRENNGDGGLPAYKYTVYIKCPSFSSTKSEVFPK